MCGSVKSGAEDRGEVELTRKHESQVEALSMNILDCWSAKYSKLTPLDKYIKSDTSE